MRFVLNVLTFLLMISMVSCNSATNSQFVKEDAEKHSNEWVEKEGKKFYYDENGVKQQNITTIIDGSKYHFDANGVMVTGIVEEDNKKYFFDDEGKLLKNEWGKYNNLYYRTDENGELITGWFQDPKDNNWYYLCKAGYMYKGQVTIDGIKYNFDSSGSMVHDDTRVIDGKIFYYDSDGKEHELKEVWLKKFYVDDFGDETSEPYVQNWPLFEGKFSNSATNNSNCQFKFLIDDKNVDLMMYEYNSLQVKGEEKYSCQIRADNGYEAKFTGEMWSDRVSFDSAGKQAILNCLKTGQNFKLRINEKAKYGTPSTYLVEVEAGNFRFVYWK